MADTSVPAKLAEDFESWWSGKRWTWSPVNSGSTVPADSTDKAFGDQLLTSGEDELKPVPELSATAPITPDPSSPTAELVSTAASSKPLEVPQTTTVYSIRPSPKGGLGIFARQDISNRTQILEESSLLESTAGDILRIYANLSAEARQKFNQLWAFEDVYPNQTVARFLTNRFKISAAHCGIFYKASRFNHSCQPNCSYHYDHIIQKLVVFAQRDIQYGEELTISYGQSPWDLAYNYGFLCDCGHCVPPSEVPGKVVW